MALLGRPPSRGPRLGDDLGPSSRNGHGLTLDTKVGPSSLTSSRFSDNVLLICPPRTT